VDIMHLVTSFYCSNGIMYWVTLKEYYLFTVILVFTRNTSEKLKLRKMVDVNWREIALYQQKSALRFLTCSVFLFQTSRNWSGRLAYVGNFNIQILVSTAYIITYGRMVFRKILFHKRVHTAFKGGFFYSQSASGESLLCLEVTN
jgi:hypothetical protein